MSLRVFHEPHPIAIARKGSSVVKELVVLWGSPPCEKDAVSRIQHKDRAMIFRTIPEVGEPFPHEAKRCMSRA